MKVILLTAAGGLLLIAVLELLQSLAVLRRLQRRQHAEPADRECPKASVILALRGADPSLPACLEALAQQDYPDFDIRVVLDNSEDPAAALVQRYATGPGGDRIHVDVLREIPGECSLKCACLAQALADLPPDTELVAFLDADAVPVRRWLRDVADRLRQSGAAAVSGIRWFDPCAGSAAAWLRYVWNAGSVVQMSRYGIAWGGCLALRRQTIAESDLVQRLRRAWGEDTVLDTVLRARGLTLDVDPTLIMVSREDTTAAGLLGWACRQLLSVRLHHAGWTTLMVSGCLQWLLILACAGLFLNGLWTGDGVRALTGGLVLLVYELLQVILLRFGEQLIRRQVPEQYPSSSPPPLLPLLPAIPLTQCLQGPLLLAAQLCRHVTWRDIAYRVGSGGQVRMLDYRPYVQGEDGGNRSL